MPAVATGASFASAAGSSSITGSAKQAGGKTVILFYLDPTVGKEIQKVLPCVVISPDEMNRHIATVLIAPMTTKMHAYPSRVLCLFEGKSGQIVLDQIRAVDKTRIGQRLGRLNKNERTSVLSILNRMFTE
jgi:mRNA interferase MazF